MSDSEYSVIKNDVIKRFDCIMVARQLKIVSQSDAFTISATRNIQYVFKKLACLIVFVKDILYIYWNNIYHIVFSSHLVR